VVENAKDMVHGEEKLISQSINAAYQGNQGRRNPSIKATYVAYKIVLALQ